jgi:signal transduction histidine kinase
MALHDLHTPRYVLDPVPEHRSFVWSGLKGANEHPRWLDPATIASQAADAVRARAQEGGQRLVVDTIGAPAPVDCDLDAAVRVVAGLLERALLLTPPGAEVVLTVQDRADEVLFAVEDAGPGLAADALQRLFGERAVAQSGVPPAGSSALEAARDRALAQGGRLWAASAPGVGTTVFFTLPRQKS